MKEERKGKQFKQKKRNVIRTNLDILPVRNYDKIQNCFVLEDGSCLDIMQIIPRDIDNMADDELQREIYSLIRAYKTIGSDIKILSMNFPLNTQKQRNVLMRHRQKTEDAVRQKWIDRQIEELLTVDSHIHTSNFYLMYFGTTAQEFKRNRENIVKYACTGIDRLVEPIPELQKLQILVKICNMNSTYDIHYFDEAREGSDEEKQKEQS